MITDKSILLPCWERFFVPWSIIIWWNSLNGYYRLPIILVINNIFFPIRYEVGSWNFVSHDRRKVWKPGGGIFNMVGIICSPGWNRVISDLLKSCVRGEGAGSYGSVIPTSPVAQCEISPIFYSRLIVLTLAACTKSYFQPITNWWRCLDYRLEYTN